MDDGDGNDPRNNDTDMECYGAVFHLTKMRMSCLTNTETNLLMRTTVTNAAK